MATKDTIIQSSQSDRLSYMTGDLFSLDNHFDGIAAFVPCGLTSFRADCERFIEMDTPGIVMIADLNKGNKIYSIVDVDRMVTNSLDALSQHGAKRIGMNGIRTDLGSGPSEKAVAQSCLQWLNAHPDTDIHITLVDKRGGFINNCI